MDWNLYWTALLQITIALLLIGPSLGLAIYLIVTPISNSIIRMSAIKRASIEVQKTSPVKGVQ